VSFDVNPEADVPECDLLHEDVEDWEAEINRPGWFHLQCEGILSPSSELAPEVPLYIREGMPFQPADRNKGIIGGVHAAQDPNNHLCVRETAASQVFTPNSFH
jgi:hypothetical protein